MNEVIVEVLAGVKGALGEDLVAMYLGGSLATGAFDPETSDVDFVVVTRDGITDQMTSALRAAHERITAGSSKWAKKLEGLYLPSETLRTRHESTQRCAYLGVGGGFTAGSYQSGWIVQVHVVREHGIVLYGPSPTSLIPPISPEELRASCKAIMRDWSALLATPHKFDDEYQAYTVLTMCRVLYTLEHARVESKPMAARWAVERYGERWKALIERALAWRQGMAFGAREAVLNMLRYTIERSEAPERDVSSEPNAMLS